MVERKGWFGERKRHADAARRKARGRKELPPLLTSSNRKMHVMEAFSTKKGAETYAMKKRKKGTPAQVRYSNGFFEVVR